MNNSFCFLFVFCIRILCSTMGRMSSESSMIDHRVKELANKGNMEDRPKTLVLITSDRVNYGDDELGSNLTWNYSRDSSSRLSAVSRILRSRDFDSPESFVFLEGTSGFPPSFDFLARRVDRRVFSWLTSPRSGSGGLNPVGTGFS